MTFAGLMLNYFVGLCITITHKLKSFNHKKNVDFSKVKLDNPGKILKCAEF